jgi:hypothetical protein
MTINSSVLTTTDINGGSIDGATVGSESANTGKFTTLEATSTINFNGANCYSLSDSTNAAGNILIGPNAGDSTVASTWGNTLIGRDAGKDATGIWNTFVGYYAGQSVTSGNTSVAFGNYALSGDSSATALTGDSNCAFGDRALYELGGSSVWNTVMGGVAGLYLESGSRNTLIGRGAGTNSDSNTQSFNDCILIGTSTGLTANGSSKAIAIGNSVIGVTDKILIGDGSTTIEASYTSGTWAPTSDRRIKKDIENSDIGLDFINALRPVCFKFKQPEDIVGDEEQAIKDCISKVDDEGNETVSKTTEIQRGFIAQEVKEAIDSLGLGGENLGWSESSSGLQRVGSGDFVPALVAAVQELSQKVKDLEDRLSD